MNTSESGSREEAYNGIRFLVGECIFQDVWRVEWRCLMRGCQVRDVAVAPNSREDAKNAAIAQMQAHSEKPHTVAHRVSTTSAARLRPFQFTLRQLLLAVAFFSAAFALSAALFRSIIGPARLREPIVWVLGSMAVLVLIGAGIGALRGSASKGAEDSIMVALVLFFFGTIAIVAVSAVLPMLR